MNARFAATLIGLTLMAGAAAAQDAQPFSTFRQDATQPLEIASDRLGVSQQAATAEFIGNVEVMQGTLTLRADRMTVRYDQESGDVRTLEARGNVLLSSGTEAAEAQSADYDVESGILVMQGDVLVTQGQSALSAQNLRIDLNAGTGDFSGRVRTVFVPQSE